MPKDNKPANKPSSGGSTLPPGFSGGGSSGRSNAPSSGSSGGGRGGGGANTITIGGQSLNIGGALGAGEAQKLANRTDLTIAQIQNRAEDKGVKVGASTNTAVNAFNLAQAQAAADAAAAAQAAADAQRKSDVQSILQDAGILGAAGDGAIGVNLVEAENARLGAELQNRASISNYGWDAQKVMENVRQAGATERQKLVNENNLAVTDKEVKGKLDLQAIVNSGYKNIANIERGSDMFKSIMGAFNF